MQLNKVRETTGKTSIRKIVDNFETDKLSITALQMKEGSGYRKYNYGQLQETVRALSNSLLRMGFKKGDHIGVISENRVEWTLSYLAAVYFGAVIVPFDILLKEEELSSVVHASGIRIVFTSSAYKEKILQAQKEALQLKQIVMFDEDPSLCEEVEHRCGRKVDISEIHKFREELSELEEREFEEGVPFRDCRFIYIESLIRLGKKLVSEKNLYYEKSIVKPEDLAALIFTSGTTGTPKGVMLSHKNLVTNADGLHMGAILGPGDNWIIVLPYHHTYPTILGVILPILTYGTITTVPTLRPNVLIQTMQETGATCIPAVPILIEKIYKNIWTGVREKGVLIAVVFRVMFAVSAFFYNLFGIKLGPVLFKSVRKQLGVTKLKFFISGAGPIPKAVIDGMEIMGLTIMQGYGLTESSPVISTTFPEHNRAGTVGLPLSNVEVRIDNPDANGDGELMTRGPHVMQGYYQQPELTAKVIDKDGWLSTGDIARIDKDGYITIRGRMKNIIVTKGGKNIYPEEIEDKLLQSEYISEAVVIPKTEGNSGEFPYAFIYPNYDAITALEKEVQHKLEPTDIHELIGKEVKSQTTTMANYKQLRGFEILDEELPKTSSKKVKRYMFKGK